MRTEKLEIDALKPVEMDFMGPTKSRRICVRLCKQEGKHLTRLDKTDPLEANNACSTFVYVSSYSIARTY